MAFPAYVAMIMRSGMQGMRRHAVVMFCLNAYSCWGQTGLDLYRCVMHNLPKLDPDLQHVNECTRKDAKGRHLSGKGHVMIAEPLKECNADVWCHSVCRLVVMYDQTYREAIDIGGESRSLQCQLSMLRH